MKIGIISDTHDSHENVLKAIDLFNDNDVDYVLHAGDIVSPFTAKAFAGLNARKFIAVYGNNDGEKMMLKNTITDFGGEIHEYCYKGTLGGKRIYMIHVPFDIDEVVKSQEYDIVIYGHTHNQDIRQEGKSLVINPGEATDWLTGAGNMVILETNDMSYEALMIK
ncbi:MAG: metallophosphoesterase [Phycisphaerae bacterium]|nr:metallophosphoesterase [Phycisphaerae bacterium]